MYQNENRPTWATRRCNVKGSKINSFVTLASYNNPILLDHPVLLKSCFLTKMDTCHSANVQLAFLSKGGG